AGSALAALNATPEQAVGRTLSKLFATLPDGEQVISAHQNALRGVSTGYEITFKGRVFQSHVEPLQAQDGSIIGTIGLGRDVTDGKRAERALGQSEERYRAFVAQSSEGIWRLEVEPPIPTSLPADEQAGLMMDRCFVRECNDVMAKMYGLSAASDLVGKSWRALHVEGDSLNLDGLRRFIASGYRTSDSESHDVNASGDIKYFANNAAGIVEHGKLVRIWGTQQDITQRKAGEAERAALLAREKTARLEAETAWLEWRQMFDAMTESVSLLDIEGRIRRANKAFYMKWGKNPSECIGKPLHQIAHKNQDEADACPICQLRGRGVRAAIEIPPGVIGQRPLYVALDPILDSNGVKTGFVQQVKDLSELYLARAQAERERTSLNATIEQMAEGLLVCDEHGSVIRANRLAQEILGIPLAEMMADTTAELPRGRFANLEGRVLEVDQLPVQRALAEKQVFDASRLWYTRPDGARILLSIVASPFLNEQGGLAGAVTLIRDVTEQQREHEHVHQADKMRALGELSSGVAHNFNNALASILGYTQLAQRTTNGTDLAKYLGIIQKSAQDAARMVERIQNFSRSHPRTGDFRPVRLMDIAIDAVEIARPRWQSDAESLGISYDVSFDWRAAEDVSVDGEPSELREVFLNIILNALDAMPSGGSLAISAVQEIEALIVSFTDTGAGMSPEIKQRVFEPFFTTKSSTGLGLGLSESYRIIERHGGRIDIDTRLHAGTTFSVMLPTRVSSGLPAQEPEREMSVRPLNILVLDDEDLVRGALAAMLAAMGHLVVEASTAQEAVAHVDAQVFDLVFTDLAMPVVDGIAAAELLKAARPNLKLILMSGYGSDKAAERAEESKSIDGVISKPFTFSEIQQIVVEVLRS
ncbi:MAG TPA: PAS domain S-box protein, partial [Blastocatellia bacterium]|nr:PAS domain S-box protein [Blastocatellia bacterium]